MDSSRREIVPINTDLPFVQIAAALNENIATIEGYAKSAAFWSSELDMMRSGLGLDKYYQSSVALGHGDADVDNWVTKFTDNGYNIWGIDVPNYAYDKNNSMVFDGIICDFAGEAISENSDTFEKVFIYSGGAYTDVSAEAASAEGTPFNINASTSEALYIGNSTIFSGVDFSWFRPGSGYANSYAYSRADSWGSGNTAVDILRDDATSNFRRDGLLRCNFPGDFAPTDVNGSSLYWLKISTTVTPSSTAMAYNIMPDTNVNNLLSLSTTELNNGVKKWCSFGTNVYLTLRNTADPRYENLLYIRSGAGINAKKTFFKSNHKVELTYKNAGYTLRLPTRTLLAFDDDCATSLSGRYVNVGGTVAGDQGHRTLRSGYLTGISVTAVTAPAGDSLVFTVRKNQVDTIISGTLLATETSSHRTDFTPQSFVAGDTIQTWAGETSATGYDNIHLDIETSEVSP